MRNRASCAVCTHRGYYASPTSISGGTVGQTTRPSFVAGVLTTLEDEDLYSRVDLPPPWRADYGAPFTEAMEIGLNWARIIDRLFHQDTMPRAICRRGKWFLATNLRAKEGWIGPSQQPPRLGAPEIPELYKQAMRLSTYKRPWYACAEDNDASRDPRGCPRGDK